MSAVDPKDRNALGIAIENFRPLIRRVTSRYVKKCPWLAEDFESEAVFELIKAADRGRELTSALVCTIARNRSVSLLRKEQLDRREFPRTAEQGSDARDPLAGLEDRARADRLSVDAEEALASLSERDREIVMRNVIYGESFQKIAASLGISKGAAHNVCKRALEALRDRLE
jgi:RNA polymerase sigma factor (sigma-70 family)